MVFPHSAVVGYLCIFILIAAAHLTTVSFKEIQIILSYWLEWKLNKLNNDITYDNIVHPWIFKKKKKKKKK